jgi:ribose transport system ATP-binding protein
MNSPTVSVLRDGQYVGSLTRDKLNASELVRMMVGRPLSDLFNKERDIPSVKRASTSIT